MNLFGCEVTAQDHINMLKISSLLLKRIEKLEQQVYELERGRR
ncbi:hypothetical protein [Nocardia jiangxiensis]|nr:hypothetical protein [Nocardia jiangxiensis]